MRPGTKLLLLALGAAGVWMLGVVGVFLVVVSDMPDVSDMGNNIGVLAAPLFYSVFGFLLAGVGGLLVALLLGISVVALNELGMFAPWPRNQVRVVAVTVSLVTLGVIVVGYRSRREFRSIIDLLLELFR